MDSLDPPLAPNTEVSEKRKTYIQSPENREWVSILECISASGRSVRPIVIFKGKNVQISWPTEDNITD